jgi:Leucine-rich repeat (LRR) protein
VLKRTGSTSLKSLNLSGTVIDDASLQSILTQCKGLVELNIADTVITEAPFAYLDADLRKRNPTEASKIEVLNVSGCPSFGDKALLYVIRTCPNLKSLDVSKCSNISTKSVFRLTTCLSLESLNLTGTNAISKFVDTAGQTASLDDTILAIADACKNFRSLVACTSPYITNNMVKYLATFCSHLEVLDVSSCANLTDEALSHLGMGCKSLKKLGVRRCPKISDKGLEIVARKARYLEVLDVSENNRLSGEFLRALKTSNPKVLKELNLTNCGNISASNIVDLVEEAMNLETLNLDKCPQISNSHISAIKNKLPKARVTSKLG